MNCGGELVLLVLGVRGGTAERGDLDRMVPDREMGIFGSHSQILIITRAGDLPATECRSLVVVVHG